MTSSLYITGAGVSKGSGIPTFRGSDGYWRIGSKNYTPQEMATRAAYRQMPDEFLFWYYSRFVKYRFADPKPIHYWLADKTLITQNIDALDKKAGNHTYIPIHGRLDLVTVYHEQKVALETRKAPWDVLQNSLQGNEDPSIVKKNLLDAFRISHKTKVPMYNDSLKPFVLLFDEFYSEMYRISDALKLIEKAKKVIFIGTSFKVNITAVALNIAKRNNALIEVIDPEPVDLGINGVNYRKITVEEYLDGMK
ncbi:MAG: Sir2 family NAD-dependent protein deacetylase [Pseudomonadota bacterium]|nr:Sir2 family NAD-dependent protein deacetylase [Pseudomonadota bacterium]